MIQLTFTLGVVAGVLATLFIELAIWFIHNEVMP